MLSCDVQIVAAEAKKHAKRLRAEVKSLLKEQYQLNTQLSEEQQELNDFTENEQAAKRHFEIAEEKESELLYCCPGRAVQTPFGVLRIREFRFVDKVLVMELPFCVPRAIAYLNTASVIKLEVSGMLLHVLYSRESWF